MFKYDSTHGVWKHGEVKAEGGKLVIGNMHIMVFHEYVLPDIPAAFAAARSDTV